MAFLITCVFSSVIYAKEGFLGGQLFLRKGDSPVVLIPSQGMEVLPRQHLWEGAGKDWVSYKGRLSSTFFGSGQLTLIYQKTAFVVGEGLTLQPLRKAPAGVSFLATSGGMSDSPVLVRRADGEFASISASGNFRPFPFLSPYRDRAVLPWSSKKYPFLFFPRQKDQEEPVLCAFDSTFESGRPFDQGMSGFSLMGISEGENGVYLMGEDGKNLLFNGSQLKPTSLPGGLSAEGLLAMAQEDGRWNGLYRNEEGHLQLALSGGETLDLPATSSSGVQVQAGNEAHLQSVMMFVVMMLALFMVLRWRQESEAKLPGKVELVPASLWLRSMAFIMDLLMLIIPCFPLALLLGFDPIYLPDPSHLAVMLDGEREEVLVRFNESIQIIALMLVTLSVPYHVLMETCLGGSLGKIFFRLKVVGEDEKAPSLKLSLAKAFWRFLDLLILPLLLVSFYMAFTHNQRLSLGDRMSGLKVVQARRN